MGTVQWASRPQGSSAGTCRDDAEAGHRSLDDEASAGTERSRSRDRSAAAGAAGKGSSAGGADPSAARREVSMLSS